MSERALEFVETWVSEKIEEMEQLPAEGDELQAKALAVECLHAAQEEGIPEAEINEVFDDLAAFVGGEIEAAREREEDRLDDDDDDDEDDEDESDEDEDEDEDEHHEDGNGKEN